MKAIIPFLLSLVFVCNVHTSIAQSFYTIKGVVTSKETNQPLQGASVYSQNTTYGTISGEDGSFSLTLPAGGYDLAISFSGKQTESRRISAADAGQLLQISLDDKKQELEPVAIVSSAEVKDGMQVYGDFFRQHFIGRTDNSYQVNILNPEVLKFFYYKRRDVLKVRASEPLKIENKALGYMVHYELDSFVYDYKNHVTLYTGFPRFTELTPVDTLQSLYWQKARKETYAGSMLHFMRSMHDKTLNKEGFEVSYIKNVGDNEEQIKLKNVYAALNYVPADSAGIVEIKPTSRTIGVIYNPKKPDAGYRIMFPEEPTGFQYSSITIPDGETISIENNGYYFDQFMMDVNGYWNWKKVADMLPYDYGMDL